MTNDPSQSSQHNTTTSQNDQNQLKLLALDQDDLQIISAHLQDAVLSLEDMTYIKSENRFVAIFKRLDWLSNQNEDQSKQKPYKNCALRIERVQNAQLNKISLSVNSGIEKLMAITFDETDAPSGYLNLHFAESRAVRFKVECIEIILRDLDATWQTNVENLKKPSAASTPNEISFKKQPS